MATNEELISYDTLRGRKRIYTDFTEINRDNVIEVLSLAITEHIQNMGEMKFLLDYEKGIQPIRQREKKVRPDIDIKVVDNIANQVTVFKMGYVWGNPILFVQRGNSDARLSDSEANSLQDIGITMLNEMNEVEFAQTKDQELARYVEITGLGYQMVDVKKPYNDLSYFDLVTLNPLFTFCIYRNTAKQEKAAAVTFRMEKLTGNRYFTVFTPTHRYEILNWAEFIDPVTGRRQPERWEHGQQSGSVNPFGAINVVEFNRSPDRTGCFERQISDMDALNIETSDFANSVAQTTQEIWWGNDFEFPVDEKGDPKPPVSGQWLVTNTQSGGNPKVQALHSELDLSGVQKNIEKKRDLILQKCYVPLQTEPGGGSTGTAMSMSSGWQAAEAAAAMEEQVLFKGKMEIAQLELIALSLANVPKSNPLMAILPGDIKPQFTRNKTYDLVSKVNGMVTMIKSGINGRVAMETVDLFPDVAQAWADSKDVVEKYQMAIINRAENTYVSAYTKREDAEKSQADLSDQASQSPIIESFKMGQQVQTMSPEHRTGGDV